MIVIRMCTRIIILYKCRTIVWFNKFSAIALLEVSLTLQHFYKLNLLYQTEHFHNKDAQQKKDAARFNL